MPNILSIVRLIGTGIKLIVNPLVKVANRAPDGTLTGIGGVIAAGGIALGAASGHIVTSENIVPIIRAVADVIVALGTVVAAFGAQRAHTP